MNARVTESARVAPLDRLEANQPRELERLASLVSIAGISAKGFPHLEVRRSAESIAELLIDARLDRVRLFETAGHPAVFGEKIIDRSLPTILIYGHHDVMPPGREECWATPPFKGTIRDDRIYGRGTADDKGGVLAYVAAVRACLEESALPCNVKMLVEGEEEIGSPHLDELLRDERALLLSDYVVLCDTPNFDSGVPALTYRLRGNCIVDVEVRCLEQPVHSGQAGGVVPDSTMILCQLLSRLQGDDGELQIAGLQERIHIDDTQLEAMRSLPYDAKLFRKRFGLVEGVELSDESESTVWERLWARPSLTVTAIEATPIAQAANQIAAVARARLSLRTVRDLDSVEAGHLFAKAIIANAPRHAQVSARVLGGPSWWEADWRHPIFAVARRALAYGFGREPMLMGSGGSIGFVKPFADLAGKTPPLLTGVQDPLSHAHSENESLHLGDWSKAMRSAVHLFYELADFHSKRGTP